MSRIIHLVSVLLLGIASVVHGQKGFMNIACGTHEDFSQTFGDFVFTSDTPYIDTGQSHTISSSVEFVYSAEYDFVKTLRSFPNGTRNCYTIKPVVEGERYLVRAYFMYGNYDALNIIPKFDIYVGTNYWKTITFTNASYALYAEIMVIAPANYLSVCLVDTNTGKPVISAIELRPLSPSMYSEVTTSQLLVYHDRTNFGENETLRYPDDPYDRIWEIYNPFRWETLTTKSSVILDNNVNKAPLKVMQTAAIPKNSSILDFAYTLKIKESTLFHFYMYFAELQSLGANQSRIYTIAVNDIVFYRSFKPDMLLTTTIHNTTSRDPGDELKFSLDKESDSTLPPLINAIEVFIVKEVNSTTSSDDVEAMVDIKSFYSVQRNWMGDPCLPKDFIWNGVGCSNENAARIITLDLSSSGLTGEITSSFAKLKKLRSLDLSTNNLTGGIPEFLGSLRELELLNLTGSGVSGPIPKSLSERIEDGSLKLIYGEGKSTVRRKTNKIAIIIASSVGSAVLLSAVVIAITIIWKRRVNERGTIPNGESELQTKPSVTMERVYSEHRKFKYDELVFITSNFEKEIGEGGFGKVYYGVLENGLPVAVKVLSKESAQGPKEFQREAQLLWKIHHKNLVCLVGCCNDTKLALVYEYMEKGSLADHLSGKTSEEDVLCFRKRLHIANDAAQGLNYLHEGCTEPIVHRDIKTSNILVGQNYEAKIADFGLSKTCNNENFTQITTAFMGTVGYLDPAYLGFNEPNPKSDVYAFGVVLLEIITGRAAIIKMSPLNVHIVDWVRPSFERGQVEKIVDPSLKVHNTNSIWRAVEIALACVAQDPTERPTMGKVVIVLNQCLELESDGTYQSSTDWEKSVEVLSWDGLKAGPSGR